MIVLDYADPPHPSSASMHAAGVEGVMRYLSFTNPNTVSKIITPLEYTGLIMDGFKVGLNWEYDSHDFVNPGFDAVGAANICQNFGNRVGYTGPFYFSIDFDITAGQWATARDRLAIIHGILGLNRTGVYGPWDALQWARRDGVSTKFWQAGMSTAWSGGRNVNDWPGAHLIQRNSIRIDGADCDRNDIMRTDWMGEPNKMIRIVHEKDNPQYYVSDGIQCRPISNLTDAQNGMKDLGYSDSDIVPVWVWPGSLFSAFGPVQGNAQSALSDTDRALIQGLTDALNAVAAHLK